MKKRTTAFRITAASLLIFVLMLAMGSFTIKSYAQEYEEIRSSIVLAEADTTNASTVTTGTDQAVSTDTVAASEGTEEEKPSLAEKLANKLSGLPDELVCFVISMIPVVELRGGLIVAAIKGIPLFRAIAVCIAGNLVPIPFILLLITPIFAWLKKTKLFKPIVEKLEKKSMGKSEKIQKYEFLGLMLFVGIPLPGTGAWTGSLIASLLEIKVKKAFPAICLGLIMATIIMCFITYGIPWLISNVF